MLKCFCKIKTKPEISVIIPIYNCEKYLKECLDSVVNQTFRDIEVICINDGSTDDTLRILRNYAEADKRIKIINQKNKGVSSARNAGLDKAKGEYIYFMDADDYLELDALNELHRLIIEKSCDLIIFKTFNFIEETGEYDYIDYHEMKELSSIVANKCFSNSDFLIEMLDVDVTVYTKFFKRKIVSDIRFVEGLIFEDNLFAVELILNAQKIYFHDKHLYHRRKRKDSLSEINSDKFMDGLEIINMIEDIFKEKGLYVYCKEILFSKKYASLNNRLNLIDEQYKMELFNRVKSDLDLKREEYDRAIDFDAINPEIHQIYTNFCNSNDYGEFKKLPIH